MTDRAEVPPDEVLPWWLAHKPLRMHNCTCGWEGDHFGIHFLDVLNGLPVEERMASVGMVRVIPASSSGLLDVNLIECWKENRRG